MENRNIYSIIIPVYNKERYIERSIKSILNQTYKNYELIIVCDPSTDDSNDIVHSIKDKRIKIFYRDRPGPGGYLARNLGVSKAKGKWIAFLDADDEWMPNHLKICDKILLKYKEKYGICTGRYHITKKSKKVDRWTSTAKELEEKLEFYQTLDNVLKRGYPWHTNSMVLNKKKFVESGMFPSHGITRGGDEIAWLNYLKNGNYLIRYNLPTILYYIKGIENQVTAKKDNIQLPVPFSNYVTNILKEKNKKNCSIIKKYLNMSTLNRLRQRARNNNFKFRDLSYLYYSNISFRNLLQIIRIITINYNIPIKRLN